MATGGRSLTRRCRGWPQHLHGSSGLPASLALPRSGEPVTLAIPPIEGRAASRQRTTYGKRIPVIVPPEAFITRLSLFSALLCALLATILVPAAGAETETLRPHAGQRVQVTKLDARLAELSYSGRLRRGGAMRVAHSLSLATRGGSVHVVVEARDSRVAAAAVRRAGGVVRHAHGGLVSALVAPAALRGLAADPAVRRVRTPAASRALSIGGEGVIATGAAPAHSGGYNGTGVKIAVVDLGFAGLAAAQTAGDVPGSVTSVDYCGGAFGTATNHGTGVAEVVHETAPGAQLYLICVDSEVSLGLAEAYAKANGIAIVNHSVGWYNTARGDGSGGAGSPDAIVADARANGILWVNAAGNSADIHWSGTYSDGNGNGYHDFVAGDDLNSFSVGAGEQACVLLKWDSWPTTSQDYDLHLYWTDALGAPAATSNMDQTGAQPPTETTCVTNVALTARDVAFAVRRESTTASPRLDVFVVGDNLGAFEHKVAASSLVEPAASASALTVGGTCWETQALEPFSSQGPTIDGRIKPDLVAPDAVSGTTYGSFGTCSGVRGFLGTSAAAPHVAGAAAIVKQLNPSFSPAQIQAQLEAAALDLGAGGRDSLYGSGALWLPFAPSVVTGSVDADATSATVRGIVNANGTGTTSYVEWGTSTAYGSTGPTSDLGAGSAQQTVSATIGELSPATLYHYRLVATSSRGTSHGLDKTFTTPVSSNGSIGGKPDLALVVGATPSGVAAGSTLTYTLTVKNKGAGGATAVRLMFTLPQAVSLVSTSATRGPGCVTSNAPRTLTCSLSSLGADRTAIVNVAVKVLKNKQLNALATVNSLEHEAVTTNNIVHHSLVASAAAAARSSLASSAKVSVRGKGLGRMLSVPVSVRSRSAVRVVVWRRGEAIAFWRRSVPAGSRVLRLAVPRGVPAGRVTVELAVTAADGDATTTTKHALTLPR